MFHLMESSVIYFEEKNGHVQTRKCDAAKIQQMDFQKILHVIPLSPLIKPTEWGFPPESITHLNPSYQLKRIGKTGATGRKPKICFVVADKNNDPSFAISRKILQFFNKLTEVKPVMVLPGPVLEALKYVANENVQMEKYDRHVETHLRDCDLLLGAGEIAIQALLNQIPVIVIGVRGYGGRVNDTNVLQFVRTEFIGRIGGALQEDIPVSLLQYELDVFLNDYQMGQVNGSKQLSNKNIEALRATYVDNGNEDKLKKLLHKNQEQHTSIMDDELIGNLKPAICSHIQIEKKEAENVYIVTNLITGKLLLTIDEETTMIGSGFDGTNTVKDIARKLPHVPVNKIMELVRNAWRNKVIHFA